MNQERPKCSVIVGTSRFGGLDVVMNSLSLQSTDSFELVLVDCLYKYRKDLVAERLRRDYPQLRVKHVEPFNNRFPVNIWSHCQNTALSYAEGDVVLITCDYSWFDSTCIARHIMFHEESGGRPRGLLQPYYYASLPALAPGFQPYITGWTFPGLLSNIAEFERLEGEVADRLVCDLDAGKLDGMMWSIFEHEFVRDDLATIRVTDIENKARLPYGPILYNYCYLKNESFPLQFVLDNGCFNEVFDGSHGHQDTEFGGRLTSRGLVMWNDPVPTITIVNPRDVLYYRKIERLGFVNKQVCEQLRNEGFPTPRNSFDVLEMRKKVLV